MEREQKQIKRSSIRRRTFLAQAGILSGLAINPGVVTADSSEKGFESATDSGRVTPPFDRLAATAIHNQLKAFRSTVVTVFPHITTTTTSI